MADVKGAGPQSAAAGHYGAMRRLSEAQDQTGSGLTLRAQQTEMARSPLMKPVISSKNKWQGRLCVAEIAHEPLTAAEVSRLQRRLDGLTEVVLNRRARPPGADRPISR